MKKKIFSLSIISLAIAATVGVTSASPSKTSGNNIISQRSGGSETVREAFSVPKGWGHVKLCLKKIKGYDVTIRFYVNENGTVINVNTFMGTADRVIGNLIK
ncbi:hypothetical protein [Paenibacillus polymyxa]|uniref:hypothetical protein n=1 Tax=Paenibacillus polymyxa TaxID=1406 RepID=UPI000B0EF50E|nr:hypothetical protein [Paenibacillus polymyxa]